MSSEKLYQELDVSAGINKLSRDLGVDLDAHQACLGAVNRGAKIRIKVNLDMCHRRYRSKHVKGAFLQNPKVLHQLNLETSHQPTIAKLKKMGFNIRVGRKNGWRLRLTHRNLSYLGKIAEKIQKEVGGIIENRANIGTSNIQHRKDLYL